MIASEDGCIPYEGCNIYYKICGPANAAKTPLLALHGGPGGSHNYLLGLAKLATDRQVIFYDQIGGGLSERPQRITWTFNLFVREIKAIRTALRLKTVHLFGHSWGGMLAVEYLLSRPRGVKSVTIASGMVNMPLYRQEVELLKKDLPSRVRTVLEHHEAAGTTGSAEYTAAMRTYNKRHIYRPARYPKAYLAPKNSFCTEVYTALWGASETYANGSLRDWDRTAHLGEITIPTLVTSGQYDELTPHQAVLTHDAIPNSQLAIFTAASHLAHIEREDDYLNVLQRFMQAAD